MRDAQHVCWKTYRKLGGSQDSSSVIASLLEDASKVSSIVKEEPEGRAKEDLLLKLPDLLYNVFVLAEQFGINVEEVFLQSVNDRILSSLS
jgi:phosphoribosyl-ATP pyrophosphohydrolase